MAVRPGEPSAEFERPLKPATVVVIGVTIPGLPEGVEAVRFGAPDLGEYVLNGSVVIGSIGRTWVGPGLVVAPAPGYEFVYDIATDQNLAIKQLDAPKVLQAKFVVTNARDEQAVRQIAAKCPGFQSIFEP